MDVVPLAMAFAGLLAAGIIKGATGLGYASCALPFLVVAVGLKPAMALVLIPAMATNLVVALTTGHLRETVGRLWPLYIAMLPGIAIGLWLLAWVDQHIAVASLGVILIASSVFSLMRPELRLPTEWQLPLQLPAGLLNGIVTGLTGSQVMPLVPYVMALDLDPARTVQGINLAVVIASVVLGFGLAAHGLLTPSLLALSVIAIIPAIAGAAIGTRLRGLIPDQRFRSITLLVLAAMGAGMLLRA